jgi:hypothetical protein
MLYLMRRIRIKMLGKLIDPGALLASYYGGNQFRQNPVIV